MSTLLRNKVAIVTGSGRGIGRAIAVCMASEGAKVVVNDLGGEADGSGGSKAAASKVAEEINSNGGTAIPNFDSVASMEGGQRIVQAALEKFGRIDILVNNAGIFKAIPFLEMTEREWDQMIQVHLKGHFACTRAAAPHMAAQRSGRIINITSASALGAINVAAHYASAKAGVLGFTRSLARELGQHGITVNAVMPAAHTRLAVGFASKTKLPTELGDMPQPPEYVAPLVAYLSTDEAANINGVTFAARVKGVVQLISDPMPVRAIYKEQPWTVAELVSLVPKLLMPG